MGLALVRFLITRPRAWSRRGGTGRKNRRWSLSILVLRARIGNGLGKSSPLFHATLVLTLVNRDDLINQFFKTFGFADCRKGVLDGVFEADIEENAFRIVVEFQRGNDLLEFDEVRGCGLRLLQA